MAVFGVQLVVTLIMVSIINKVSAHFSFGRWVLCSTGLYRYLHPTDDELRTKAGIPKERHTSKGGGAKNSKNANGKNGFSSSTPGQFHVPRNIDVELETTPVTERDIAQLRFFTEYQWLVDFSAYAAAVYVFSECYHYFIPLKHETNLSMIWCLLVVFFAIKLLFSLTVLYFESEESIGERSMVIVAGLVYLLIAMIVLIIPETILETGLEEAYLSFNRSASEFLAEQGLPSSGPASKIVVKFFLALSCGLLGALFTFPGLRMAKMHWDSLKYCSGNKFKQILLNISFVLPFILVILWIRPISRDYLTIRVFEGMEKPLLTPEAFESLRLVLVILSVVLRFTLMPIYLQSYLNLAYDKIVDLRKEAGRITNFEFQKKICSIFYYLCVVTLQFFAPLVLCLFLTLMYKSLGGYSWFSMYNATVIQNTTSNAVEVTTQDSLLQGSGLEISGDDLKDFVEGSGFVPSETENYNIMESAQNLQDQFTTLRNVFSQEFYKGFLGFATWWSYFTLFATSSLGIVYQTYFHNT